MAARKSGKRRCIYVLTNPDGEVRYVGQTCRPRERYRQHTSLSCNHGDSHRCRWIRSLLNKGERPTLTVIERCWDADAAEVRRIAEYRASGHTLTNSNDGGSDVSHAQQGKARMPWAGRQAPLQRALIATKGIVKEMRESGREERAYKLEAKLKEMQDWVNELKKDRDLYIYANLRYAERRGWDY